MKYLIFIFLLIPILIFSQTKEIQKNDNPTDVKKLYTKGSVKFGVGFEKYFMFEKYYENTGKDAGDAYIYPGGGTGIEAILGYNINPRVSSEIGIGYVSSGESVKDASASFNKSILHASIIYRLKKSKTYIPYFGAGFSTNLSVNLKAEADDEKFEFLYKKPVGFSLFGGAEFENLQSPVYGIVEIRLLMLGEYHIEEAEFDGIAIPVSYVADDFRNMNANGIHIKVGVGYYLK